MNVKRSINSGFCLRTFRSSDKWLRFLMCEFETHWAGFLPSSKCRSKKSRFLFCSDQFSSSLVQIYVCKFCCCLWSASCKNEYDFLCMNKWKYKCVVAMTLSIRNVTYFALILSNVYFKMRFHSLELFEILFEPFFCIENSIFVANWMNIWIECRSKNHFEK